MPDKREKGEQGKRKKEKGKKGKRENSGDAPCHLSRRQLSHPAREPLLTLALPARLQVCLETRNHVGKVRLVALEFLPHDAKLREFVVVGTSEKHKILVCNSVVGLVQGRAEGLVVALGDGVEEDLAVE